MPAMKDIPAHFVTEYASNWEHLCQQKMSKTRECVTVDTVHGKEKKYNQFDTTEMDPVTVRAGDTRISDTNLPARWLRPYPLDKAYLFDEWDEDFLGEVVLPQSESIANHGFAYNRAVDRTVIKAALNIAYTGEIGVDPTPLPAGQVIPVNFVETGSPGANLGLTIGKLRQAKFMLDNADVDDEDPRYMAITAKSLQDLLRTTEVTSSDYNSVKALVEGTVNSFLGFTFKRVSNKIMPLDAVTDIRTCVAWAKSGIKITDSGKEVQIDRRPDKSNALQIRTVALLGGTRMEEVKVVSILCDESP
jgi:Phage capsid protein